MSVILSENFDDVTAPALPATLSFGVGFETTTNSPSSAPNALRNSTTGQKDSYTLVKDGVNGDSTVSVDVSFTAAGGSDSVQLPLRSLAQSFANQYFVKIAGNGQLNLWYRSASSSTQVGSTVTVSGGLTNNAKYRLYFSAIGNTLTVRLVRNSDGFYLNSSGTFQAGAADAISQTHSTLNGQQGYSGITIANAAANRVQVDNFVFTTEGVLTITPPTVTAFDEDSITFSVSSSGGGNTHTYQWYLKTAAGDGLSASNDVPGATTTTPTITLADGLSASIIKYIECRVTDNLAATADSGSIPVLLGAPPAPLQLVIGPMDSIGRTPNGTTDNYGFYMAKVLEAIGGLRTVSLLIGAVSGSNSSNGSAGWGPSATSDASAGDNALLAAEGSVRYLTALKNVIEDTFGTPDRDTNPVYVCIGLGRNDALSNTAAATFGTQMDAIVDDLVAFGVYVVLECPIASAPPASSWADTKTDLVYAYQAELAALVNGMTVLQGDTTCFTTVGMRHDQLLADYIHPNTTGAKLMGAAKAVALATALGLIASEEEGGGAGSVIGEAGVIS